MISLDELITDDYIAGIDAQPLTLHIRSTLTRLPKRTRCYKCGMRRVVFSIQLISRRAGHNVAVFTGHPVCMRCAGIR